MYYWFGQSFLSLYRTSGSWDISMKNCYSTKIWKYIITRLVLNTNTSCFDNCIIILYVCSHSYILHNKGGWHFKNSNSMNLPPLHGLAEDTMMRVFFLQESYVKWHSLLYVTPFEPQTCWLVVWHCGPHLSMSKFS